MRLKKERGLRTTLMLLLGLTAFATLATLLIASSGFMLWRLPQMHQENLIQVRREAQQLAERMEIMLGGLQHQLELAGIALSQLPENAQAPFLNALTFKGRSFEAIYLVDSEGRVEALNTSLLPSVYSASDLIGSDLSSNQLYRSVMRQKSTVWSNKFLSALSGTVTVGIAIPVANRVLIGELSLSELLRTLNLASRDSRLSIWVIDQTGELVLETGSGHKLGPANLMGMPIIKAALRDSPLPDIIRFGNKEFYPALARSSMVDWYFLVRLPAGLNTPDILSALLLIAIVLICFILIGLLLAPLFANWISRPLQAITERARHILHGQTSGNWPRGPISELNALAGDLETMANHLQERKDQLGEAQRIAGIGSWEHRLDNNAIIWSEGMNRILGRDPALDAPGFDALPQFYRAESWQQLKAAVATTIETGVPYELELEMIRANGTSCWTTTRGEVVPGPDGNATKLRGTVHDITAHRRAEEKVRASLSEKEVLLKEIYHRVKNNLQVVSSLLNLQSRRVANKETKRLLDDSANRIKSMALVHEQLYRSDNLSSIALRKYLQQLTLSLSSMNESVSRHVRLQLEMEELYLGIESAIPLGLIVNELVSNAYRHGYESSTMKGVILLRITPQSCGKILLEVKDDGRGLPADFEPGRGTSLGMQLVVTLTQQLGGELKWESANPGAYFRLQFKPAIFSTEPISE